MSTTKCGLPCKPKTIRIYRKKKKKREKRKVELVAVLYGNINTREKTTCLLELNHMSLLLDDVPSSNLLFYYLKLPFAT